MHSRRETQKLLSHTRRGRDGWSKRKFQREDNKKVISLRGRECFHQEDEVRN